MSNEDPWKKDDDNSTPEDDDWGASDAQSADSLDWDDDDWGMDETSSEGASGDVDDWDWGDEEETSASVSSEDSTENLDDWGDSDEAQPEEPDEPAPPAFDAENDAPQRKVDRVREAVEQRTSLNETEEQSEARSTADKPADEPGLKSKPESDDSATSADEDFWGDDAETTQVDAPQEEDPFSPGDSADETPQHPKPPSDKEPITGEGWLSRQAEAHQANQATPEPSPLDTSEKADDTLEEWRAQNNALDGWDEKSPDLGASGIFAIIASFLIPGLGHAFVKQGKKGLAIFAAYMAAIVLTCGTASFLAPFIHFAAAIDAYMVARVRKKRMVDDWEFFPRN